MPNLLHKGNKTMTHTTMVSMRIADDIKRLSKAHGVHIDIALDRERGVSNEGFVKMPSGDIKRPYSDYARNIIASTVLVEVSENENQDSDQRLDLTSSIRSMLKQKNLPLDLVSLVYKKKTNSGVRYSTVKQDDTCVVSHYIYAIPTKPDAISYSLDDLSAVQEHFRLEVDLYSSWLNNEVYKVEVSPRSSGYVNLFGSPDRGWSAITGNVYHAGNSAAFNSPYPDDLAEQLMYRALINAGHSIKFSFSSKKCDFELIDVMAVISNEITNKFEFAPVVKSIDSKDLNAKYNSITLNITEASIPSVSVLVSKHLSSASYDKNGFLEQDFLKEVMNTVANELSKSSLSELDIMKKQLTISNFLNELLVHESILVQADGYNNYYKKDSISMPFILVQAVLFTIFKISCPEFVSDLILNN